MMESDNKIDTSSDIKKGLKATSLFGGVEVLGIGITIIRTKLIALLIGPVGVGLLELYSSTIRLISSLTSFSLSTSAVRDVSVSYKSNDKDRFSQVISSFSKIVWFTGLLGTIVCLLGAPLWSKFTFGDYSYTYGFIALSVVLLLNQLTVGNTVILQGIGKYKYMAISSILGNAIGLLTTIPIYYFLRTDGIVAALIITSIVSYFLSYYYKRKLKLLYPRVSTRDVFSNGKTMLHQGFLLSLNFLYSTLIFYVLRIFITTNGGIAELGLYSASFAIVNTYVGLVFQAMGKEYYPRLATISSDNEKFNSAINSQIYLILLILAPLVIFFLFFSEQLLFLLYSEKFLGASIMLSLSMLGVIFQAPSVCMGYAFLAKADNKLFLIYESISKSLKLLTDILFYYMWGLTGLGVSFIVSYLYYTIQCIVVCHHLYDFSIQKKTIVRLLWYVVLGCIAILTSLYTQLISKIVIGFVFFALVSFDSYRQISDYINFHSILKQIKNRL